MKITVFDTETTGLTKFKSSYCDPGQPAPVSIGAVTMDYVTGEVETFYTLIKLPDDVFMEPKAEEIHGISREKANAEGMDQEEALAKLEGMFANSFIVSAYNINFDDIVYKAMACRLHGPRDETTSPFYAGKKKQCIMNICATRFRIPHKSGFGFQPLKLNMAYKRVVGVELKDAHNALIDAQAACDIQTVLLKEQYERALAAKVSTEPMRFHLLTAPNV